MVAGVLGGFVVWSFFGRGLVGWCGVHFGCWFVGCSLFYFEIVDVVCGFFLNIYIF